MTIEQARQLFDIMFAQWPKDSIFRYFARRPKDERVHGQAVLSPGELVQVTKWADTCGFNSYVQVNPSKKRTGVRCSGADITHWNWFLFDIDPISAGNDPILRREAAHHALMVAERLLRNYMGSLGDLKRVIIDSGRGVQGWYSLKMDLSGDWTGRTAPLPRMWEEGEEKENTVSLPMREAVPRAMSYWLGFFRERLSLAGLDECVIDTSVSDLPRVMRIPHTVNAKTGIEGSLMHYDEGYNTGLAHKLLGYAPYELWRPKDPTLALMGADASTPWDQFVKHMTRGGRIFLTEGASEGGRHHAAVSALKSLKELGCGKEQARAALIWGGELSTPVLEAREIHPMIERHWRGNGSS